MKTLSINLSKDYSRLSSLIQAKGVKYSHHGFNVDTLITATHKYVFDLNAETLSISHFDYYVPTSAVVSIQPSLQAAINAGTKELCAYTGCSTLYTTYEVLPDNKVKINAYGRSLHTIIAYSK